jgi:hypothetical protein
MFGCKREAYSYLLILQQIICETYGIEEKIRLLQPTLPTA